MFQTQGDKAEGLLTSSGHVQPSWIQNLNRRYNIDDFTEMFTLLNFHLIYISTLEKLDWIEV